MSVLTESRGWTTHFHALLGLLCCVVGLYAVILNDVKVAGIFGFLALMNILCAQGCMRQKLEKLQK